MNKFSLLLNGLSDLIFPFSCAVCHKGLEVRLGRQYLCAECLGKIRLIVKEESCSCCGKESAISPCRSCKEKKYYFKKACSAGVYDGVLKECIHMLKYNKKTYLARPLGKLLGLAYHEQDLSKAELLVPVPLDRRRYRERGFNQAQLLAAVVSKEVGIPISGSLHRTGNAPSQTQLSRQERLKNVKGLFKVARNDGVINKSVLLIDDVFTTGATADECARALSNAGAQEVNVLTVARSE